MGCHFLFNSPCYKGETSFYRRKSSSPYQGVRKDLTAFLRKCFVPAWRFWHSERRRGKFSWPSNSLHLIHLHLIAHRPGGQTMRQPQRPTPMASPGRITSKIMPRLRQRSPPSSRDPSYRLTSSCSS